MRILTLHEPFATLISNKVKTIETRSWKTNYRGEIYIHAGQKKPAYDYKSDEFKKIADKYTFSPGVVLCKCNLIDCIEMTDEYIEKIKREDHINYICGEYSIGRYAWILADIKPIKRFYVKGHLGICHYNEGDEINE